MKKLARQFKESHAPHVSIGFDPGFVQSNSMAELPTFFRAIAKLVGKPPEQAARKLADLIMHEQLDNGNFYNKQGKPIPLNAYAEDKTVQDKIWDVARPASQMR